MEQTKYTQSEKVRRALEAAQSSAQRKPEKFQWASEEALRSALEELVGQEEFSYRLDADALYRQYRDAARADGRMAMEDTMGKAASLTGGYGNSYALTASQQSYNQALSGLADRIPELYALAVEQYKLKHQGLKDRYDLLSGQKQRSYQAWLDSLNAWQKEADSLWTGYQAEADRDYEQYRDTVKDSQWQQEFDENKRRYDQQWEADHPATPPASRYPLLSGGRVTSKKETKKTGKTGKTEKPIGGSALAGALSALGGKKKK